MTEDRDVNADMILTGATTVEEARREIYQLLREASGVKGASGAKAGVRHAFAPWQIGAVMRESEAGAGPCRRRRRCRKRDETMTAERLRCGLIGANLGRSRFAAGLELLCRAQDLRLEFELIDSAGQEDFEFDAALEACRAQGWSGVNVTHPFKTEAAAWLGPRLSPAMRRLGSCNQIVFAETGAEGRNTDYAGFIAAWREAMGAARPGRVAMAGAGGVARALGHALADLGAAEVVLWDTRAEQAEALARAIGPAARAVGVGDVPAVLAEAQGLVNATPLGMHAYPGSAFPLPLPQPPDWVFDAVYTPVETPLVMAARDVGAAVISGFDLFRHMALSSFEAYTGLAPDTGPALAMLDRLKPQED